MSDSEHKANAEPTPGPWKVPSHASHIVVQDDDSPTKVAKMIRGYSSARNKQANARLIAAAGTAAQEVKEMGYDPVAVQKVLSEILRAAEALIESAEQEVGEAAFANSPPKLLESPSRDTIDALKDALASAEGSEE